MWDSSGSCFFEIASLEVWMFIIKEGHFLQHLLTARLICVPNVLKCFVELKTVFSWGLDRACKNALHCQAFLWFVGRKRCFFREIWSWSLVLETFSDSVYVSFPPHWIKKDSEIVLPAETDCGDTLVRLVNNLDVFKCFRECLFPFICNLSIRWL